MTVTSEETRFFLPCGCAGNCTILAVDRWRWDDNSPHEWWFDFYTRANEGASFWYRLKHAWRTLRGKDHYFDSLTWSDEEIQKLRDFIDTQLS